MDRGTQQPTRAAYTGNATKGGDETVPSNLVLKTQGNSSEETLCMSSKKLRSHSDHSRTLLKHCH